MEDLQVTTLGRLVSAVNAGDAARYAELYASDAVITIFGLGRLEGHEAIERHEVDLLRQFPGTRLGFYSLWRKGETAVVHYAVNGETPEGRAMGHEGLLFYQFEASGLIRSERRYMDSLTPMAQAGMLGESASRPMPALPHGMTVHPAAAPGDDGANVALLKAMLSAMDRKNEAALVWNFAEEAAIDELILPRPFLGAGSAASWFDAWTRAVPDAASEITGAMGTIGAIGAIGIMGVGEFVMAETVVRGTVDGRFGPLRPSSAPFTAHRAILARVKEGKLVSLTGFMNAKEIAQAIGQWPPPSPS